jgi:Uncharacterised nucleotidyltransferase
MRRSPRRRVRALLSLCRILQSPPRGWPETSDWDDVLSVARELWVLPSLGYALRDVPAAELPREYYRENTLRNLRFRHQLIEAGQALNQAGIQPLLFKGALALVDGTVASPGYRGLGDLDLAVPTDALGIAADALGELGYAPDRTWVLLHPHVLPMTKRRVPGAIELHVELGSPRTAAVLPMAAAWSDSTEISFEGVRARALSPTHQVLHSVLHASVQDLGHAVAALPLRQLLTLAHLGRVHGSAVDWNAIRGQMDAHGLAKVFRDHVWLAHRLAGLALPDGSWGGRGERRHELRVLANFGLGWPAHVHRNLLDAFDRGYLDALYAHGDRPVKLARAWGRHAAHLLRRDGLGVVRRGLARRA